MTKSRIVLCLLLTLALSAIGFAQAPTPSPTPAAATCAVGNPTSNPNCGLHFITEANIYQNSDGTTAQSFAAVVPLYSHVRVGIAEVLNPDAKGNQSFGIIEYGAKLGYLFKSLTSPQNALNLSNIRIYGRMGLGDEQQNVTGNNKVRNFAYGFWGGADVKLGQITGGTVTAGFRIGYVGVPTAGEHFVFGSPSNVVAGSTISVSF